MKTPIVSAVVAGLFIAATGSLHAQAALNADLLRDQGAPSGSALQALPTGAVVHLQLENPLAALEGVEKTVVPALPTKLLPPGVQPLLQASGSHPLLFALGSGLIQEPLAAEGAANKLGLKLQGTFTFTLYPGDPRYSWILSAPMGSRAALANVLNAALKPSVVEEVSFPDGQAIRVVSKQLRELPEIYLVCSRDRLFVCGGRAMAEALSSAPLNQRLANDPFIQRAEADVGGRTLTLLVNPALLRPLTYQLQEARIIGFPMLQRLGRNFLAKIPPQARDQIEMRLQAEMGVRNLNQFREYAEAVLVATADQLLDCITGQAIAFEGVSASVDLRSATPELRVCVYSHSFQPGKSTAAIPLPEVRKAMTWLGGNYGSYTVRGRAPQRGASPVLIAWVKAVRQQFEQRGLQSTYFDRLADMLATQRAPKPMAARVPWMMTTRVPMAQEPSLSQSKSLSDYLRNLKLPLARDVKMIPGSNVDVLEDCFKEETATWNHNRALATKFQHEVTGQTPFIRTVDRFHAVQVTPDVRRLVLEHSWITRCGFFGYDQHELINRRIFAARALDGYVLYYHGGQNIRWLENLDPEPTHQLAPAVSKLLDQVPAGANWFTIQRVLYRLPVAVDWLAALEDRIDADAQAYLDKAQQVLDSASNRKQGLAALEKLPIPAEIFSLNRDPATGKLYCLLPGGLVVPRPKVVPLVQDLLSDYAAHANEGGGLLAYTRVRPGVWEFSARADTSGFARLISSVGNRLFDRYLSSPEKQQQIWRNLMDPRDGQRAIWDHVLIRNPRWYFIQVPKPRHPAPVPKSIPHRSGDASANQINLSPYYNGALTETWQAGGMANNTFADLPRGLQEFGGVKFDVRGVVQLSGQGPEQQLTVRFPKAVRNIKIGRKSTQLHFLHAAAWASPRGTTIGRYVVHYANGDKRDIPIVYGKDVRDWWTPAAEESWPDVVKPVWTGGRRVGSTRPAHGVYLTSWTNPLPDVTVNSLDYQSTMQNSGPFLIALTAE